jgi:cell division protein FtsB
MRYRRGITLLTAVLLAILLAPAVRAQSGSTDDRVRRLEQEVAQLKAEIAALKNGAPSTGVDHTAELERRLEVLAEEIEKLKIGEAAAAADRSDHGLGPAASKVYRTERGISIGGYGELAYQHIQGPAEAEALRGGKAAEEEEDALPGDHADVRRAVVYFGYKWSDRILFNSEVEYEHAGGEISVEFAYLDFLWRPQANFRAGLVLLPVGFVNELHEPTVLLGADRPLVEQRILPSTWREMGFGLFGQAGPLTYRTYVVNGLDASGFNDDGLAGGRQGGNQSKARDLAWVGRLDFAGVPGLIVGGSAYAGKAGQDLETPAGRRVGVDTRIFEGHLEWKWRGLEFRALGAQGRLSDVAVLNAALGLDGQDSVGERLQGYYVQLGYDLLSGRGGQRALIPYLRWETLNTQDEVPAGFSANPDTDIRSFTLGLEYKPIEQVVVKADYQDVHNRARTGADRFTLLLGYVF